MTVINTNSLPQCYYITAELLDIFKLNLHKKNSLRQIRNGERRNAFISRCYTQSMRFVWNLSNDMFGGWEKSVYVIWWKQGHMLEWDKIVYTRHFVKSHRPHIHDTKLRKTCSSHSKMHPIPVLIRDNDTKLYWI